MAKLGRRPSNAEIMTLRGRVDLYEWKGVWVARSWPRPSGPRVKSAAEQQSVDTFTTVAKMTGGLGSNLPEAFREWTGGYGYSWVDMFRALARNKGWWRLSG